jgi:hypothetical protein
MNIQRMVAPALGALVLSAVIGVVASPMVTRAEDGDTAVMVEPGPPNSGPDGGFVECVPAQDTNNHWVCTDQKTGQTWDCVQNFEYCIDGGIPDGGPHGGPGGGAGGTASANSTGGPGLHPHGRTLSTVTPTPKTTVMQGAAGHTAALAHTLTATPTPTSPPTAPGPHPLPSGRGAGVSFGK